MTATLNHPPAVTAVTRPADNFSTAAEPPRRGRLARLALGPVGDPRWARPALWALLLAAAALYLINLSVSGYANDFYAAAVKSGTQSWTAWLFGSLDSADAITVDKPPASLWIMGLSARLLGFSSFSLLLPQALMGVGTVAVTYAAVKRWSGPTAGLVAGGLVLLTPVAALMFRFDNPDALLVLLMAVAAYFVVRAIETPRGAVALRWLLLAGAAIGFAFLTKMLQGLLVLPAFGAAYLLAAPRGLWTRIWHLLAAAGAVVVSAGWFVALVALWPAASRPYIGGSENNSLWELAIGYNGLGRIFGSTGNGGGGGGGMGGGNTGFGGTAGLGRMFNSAFGTEISWLLPAALVGLLAGAWFTRRYARTDRVRASLIVFGGSTVVTALVFSFMEGTIHPYYAVALAPFLAGTVAVSGRELWRGRENPTVRALLGAMIAITGVWSFVLLGRDATFLPWLRWLVVIGAVVGAVLLALGGGRLKKLAVVGLLVGSVTALSGTAAWTVATAAQAHSGSIPTSGPASASSGGMGGTGGGGTTGTPPTGTAPGGTTGAAPGGTTDGTGAARGGTGTRGGTAGGAGTNSELVALLNATDTRWSAAVSGSQSAAGYILGTDTAVMAIGGWGGSDPAPTLAEFQQDVADGEISYYISGGGMGGGGMGGGGTGGGTASTGSQIAAWVQATFTATTVGGATVYDLTTPAG